MDCAFECKIKGGFSPNGLSKVFIACHSDDVAYCQTITEDVQRISNCAVYYLKDGIAAPDHQMVYTWLMGMSVIILLVTTKFLTDPPMLKEQVFDISKAMNIPIIPISMEESIEDLFLLHKESIAERYRELQMLNYHSKDATEIPYIDKLTTALRPILPTEEDYQLIKQAFSSQIFLSYRKKDRADALELMNRLHHIDGFYRFSIWYDELLEIGEQWNDEILERLRASDIFLLLTTPSILEEGNFCQTHEYPAAKEQSMEMVAVQMKQMLPQQLRTFQNLYPHIGSPIDGTDTVVLTAVFSKYLSDIQSDPQTRYYIGLAFLIGVNVEKDSNLALQLITSAAQDGHIPAMEHLADMYRKGIGIPVDHHKAALWREKTVTALRNSFTQQPWYDTAVHSCKAMQKLVRAWMHISEYEKASSAACQMLKWVAYLYNDWHIEAVFQYYTTAINLAGQINFAQRNFDQALFYYNEYCSVHEELVQHSNTEINIHNLSVAYEGMGLLYFKLRKFNDAEIWYEKALDIREQLFQARNDRDAASSIVHLHAELGDLYLRTKDTQAAENHYQLAKQIIERLLHANEHVSLRSRYANIIGTLGYVQLQMGNSTQARQNFEESLEINRRVASEEQTPEALRNLSIALNKMGALEFREGNHTRSAKYYSESLALRKKLYQLAKDPDAAFDTALVYYYLAEVNRDGIKLDQAIVYYKKAIELLEPILPHDQILDPHVIYARSLFEVFRVDTYRGEQYLRKAIASLQWLMERAPEQKEYLQLYKQYSTIFQKCYPGCNLAKE